MQTSRYRGKAGNHEVQELASAHTDRAADAT